MKWFAGVMPLLVLLGATPVFGAAPVIRSSVQASSQAEVNRPVVLSLEDRLQLMERRMQALTDILMRLDRIQQEMQQLRGDVEMQGHAVESLKKRQRDLYGDIDRRMMQLTGKRLPSAVPPAPYPVRSLSAPGHIVDPGTGMQHTGIPSPTTLPASQPTAAASSGAASPEAGQTAPQDVPIKEASAPLPTAGVSVVTSTPTVGETPEAVIAPAPGLGAEPVVATPVAPAADPALEQPMYKQAFDLLMQRRYDEAKQGFRTFLRQYPNGRLAANAQYWVGEASYVTRDFVTALDEFTRVVQNYPTSPKVSDSMLKIAFIQYEQKEWVKARETLEAVINQYATTTAARLARKRLERMRIEGN